MGHIDDKSGRGGGVGGQGWLGRDHRQDPGLPITPTHPHCSVQIHSVYRGMIAGDHSEEAKLEHSR